MPNPTILLLIQTPSVTVVDRRVRALRVPTQTGQVGIRPGIEPLVLIVEPGLVSLVDEEETSYVGTAGGLLEASRVAVKLVTPFAITGTSPDQILTELNAQLGTPNSELVARRRLGELEARLIEQLKSDTPKRRLTGLAND